MIRKREICEEMIKTLKKCLDYINEVRDFSLNSNDLMSD